MSARRICLSKCARQLRRFDSGAVRRRGRPIVLSVRYIPYMFLRELSGDPPVKYEGDDPSWRTRLPYVAFLERHQSRWSPYWEDTHGTITALDFLFVLRCAFVAEQGTERDERLRAAGDALAAQLNQVEADDQRALALLGCERLIEDWPGDRAGRRAPLFVAAHNFDAWNHREHVWRAIRATPVRFSPIPSEDINTLNRWLADRYRLPRHPARFEDALKQASTSAKRSNTPRKLVCDGLLAALANSAALTSWHAGEH